MEGKMKMSEEKRRGGGVGYSGGVGFRGMVSRL